MTSRDALLALADRAEQATGPDRELDGDIALGVDKLTFAQLLEWREHLDIMHHPEVAADVRSPRYYTASLDHALTLRPEGWHVSQWEQDWRSMRWNARLSQFASEKQIAAFDAGRTICLQTADATPDAATPALALCAAALRARANMENEDG